ncbi:hypothetical protein GO986_00070 [Deinococcus sp. HMF7620]|uniref:Uncharacterized protein n=1 Tax=Deinococcus arboris TaxID=2682977 RepID=A0A7C9HPF4_9DEIO|nr:hypothetical protein [Deinococcus arboris]MVN85167.1 hypothetical protein [Deinococcus arboris]
MTAKRKNSGKWQRLAVLEEAHSAKGEAVRAQNWAYIEAAERRLSAADRAAWQDAAQVIERGAEPEVLDRLRVACAHLPPDLPHVAHPAKDEAQAWANGVDFSDGAPLLPPPATRAAAFASYFEAGAQWCDREAVRLPLSPDVHRLARWGAALWRFEGGLCAVLGGLA